MKKTLYELFKLGQEGNEEAKIELYKKFLDMYSDIGDFLEDGHTVTITQKWRGEWNGNNRGYVYTAQFPTYEVN